MARRSLAALRTSTSFLPTLQVCDALLSVAAHALQMGAGASFFLKVLMDFRDAHALLDITAVAGRVVRPAEDRTRINQLFDRNSFSR